MDSSKLLFLGLLAAAPAALMPSEAAAQDYDNLDSDEASSKKKRSSRSAADVARDQVVREIVKGWYAKANVGGSIYLGDFRGFVSPGTSLGLAVGQDFIDQETTSMAWELAFFQGINNGCHYEYQADGLCSGAPGQTAPYVQGDIRTYAFTGLVEYSFYPNRRVGVGLRAGGGVLFSPLLMDEGYYLDEVIGRAWGGINPGYHDSPHPVVMGGPTFEYYTKLSHFSVGADVDVFYGIGFDLGTNITGVLKYTF